MVPDSSMPTDPQFETEQKIAEKHRFKIEDEPRVRELLRRRRMTGKLIIDIFHGGTNQVYFVQGQEVEIDYE